MPVTTNGFSYRDNSSTIDPYAGDAQLATSIDSWAELREIPDYLWANAAARTAEIGMVNGAEGYQVDTAMTYKYDGTTWKMWHSLKPKSFTPTWTNITVGNATQNWTYTVAAGLVTVRGWIALGSTSSVAGGIGAYMTLPLPANGLITGAPNGGQDQALGTSFMADTGVAIYPGVTLAYVLTSVVYARFWAILASGTFGAAAPLITTTPFSWANGDYLNAVFTYPPD